MNEPIELKREVEATQIPSGYKVMLPQGMRVQITQSLGGHFTVMTDMGHLVRIADVDGDALGAEVVQQAQEAEAARVEGPFELEKVMDELKTVYDPEIPVNIVDLGLIYECQANPMETGGHKVEIKMSMTAPGCGMGDIIREDVRRKVTLLPGVAEVQVDLVWDPPWDQSRMSEVARLQLGWM